MRPLLPSDTAAMVIIIGTPYLMIVALALFHALTCGGC